MRRGWILGLLLVVALGCGALAQWTTNRPVITNLAPRWTTNRPAATNLSVRWTTNQPTVAPWLTLKPGPWYFEAYFQCIEPSDDGFITNIILNVFSWTNSSAPATGGVWVLQIAPTNGPWIHFGTLPAWRVTNAVGPVRFSGFYPLPETFNGVPMRTRVRWESGPHVVSEWSPVRTNAVTWQQP